MRISDDHFSSRESARDFNLGLNRTCFPGDRDLLPLLLRVRTPNTSACTRRPSKRRRSSTGKGPPSASREDKLGLRKNTKGFYLTDSQSQGYVYDKRFLGFWKTFLFFLSLRRFYEEELRRKQTLEMEQEEERRRYLEEQSKQREHISRSKELYTQQLQKDMQKKEHLITRPTELRPERLVFRRRTKVDPLARSLARSTVGSCVSMPVTQQSSANSGLFRTQFRPARSSRFSSSLPLGCDFSRLPEDDQSDTLAHGPSGLAARADSLNNS